jgi:long-chain fatty acid transport protein
VLPPQNPIALADPSGQLDPDLPLPVDLVLIVSDLYSEGRPLADSTASTSITMPAQITIGVAYDVTDKLTLLGDWQWVRWSVFDTLTINFDNAATPTITLVENYNNTNAFRFGAEYALNPGWTFRGGYLHHGAATPDETVTPLLPESARNEVTAGVGIDLSKTLRLDLAYHDLRQDKRRGRLEEAPPGTPAPIIVSDINSGLYAFTAHLFGATITVRF